MTFNAARCRTRNLKAVVDGNTGALVKWMETHPEDIARAATVEDCIARGYAPKGYGLADFTIVRQGEEFHLFHIPRVPGNSCFHISNEHWLGHAVSRDLDTWRSLDPPLLVRPDTYYESSHVWAPYAHREDGRCLLFYTGLSAEPSQVICLAESDDPGLLHWQRSDCNPITPLGGFDWHWLNTAGHVRHARDPHLVRVDGHYLLVYTAMHRDGCPAVGGLVSDDLASWEDIGPVLYRPMDPATWLPESVTIQKLPDGEWALLASQSPGIEYYVSKDPHHWHGCTPRQVDYEGRDSAELVAPEIIARHDEALQWLIAFFEAHDNRLFFGTLDCSRDPWRVRRIQERTELEGWL